ncbi:putative membrane-associated kinase regulator 2 [Raphanus sativus]|uniref:Probable membrane-associated kinase regulator 2 n=1 Tax=Raphanus sativus TaxID=3726 RepID=A0A6J0L048_RAPSA|nr:probable membrane-associated kinase regulator 2 [Raphanus sativus]KAJ4877245.1 putative membrane-associated kinase regulator 2 [Raphanus sativus]
MEAFSLLNYWKNNGAGGGGNVSSGLTFLPPQPSDSSCRYPGEATTIVTSVAETEEEEDAGDDEGPFFDLKFAVPLEEEEESEERDEVSEDSDDVGGGGRTGEGDSDGCEYKFTLSSSCSGGEDGAVDHQDLIVSPSGDVYLKGQIVEEEEEAEAPSTGTEQTCSVKAPAAQLSASILKSATKLRVFMLGGAKKPKLLQAKSRDPPPTESQLKSTVTVSLKAEEVPIVSLFTRDNSSRNSSSSSSNSPATKRQNDSEPVVSEDNRFVMMQKYLKKVKPLYIRVSRRYGDKSKHSGPLSLDSSSAPTATKEESPVKKAHKPGNININIPAGFKVVRKHLGKSRSSSSTTTAIPPPATTVTMPSESRRRDDSLLQQQDSIQSAILHCKRSFNSSRDKDPSVLPRSVSDSSSYDK